MRTEPLAAINSVALAIGSFDSLTGMLDYAIAKVLEVVDAEAAGVYLLDEGRARLTFIAHQGLSPAACADFDGLPLGEGLSGLVALEGVPMVVRNLKDHPRLTRMAARTEGFCAFASVPLRSSHTTHGTLNIYSREERDFSNEDIQLMTAMASQIGLAVANTRLYLELQASERKFRGLVESAKDLIYLVDRQGRIVYINPASASRLGLPPEELYRGERSLLSLVHPDDRDGLAAALERTLAGEVLPPLELRMIRADDSVRWFAQTMMPFRDAAGAVVGVHAIAYDRTRRREMEAQMARAERLADLGRMAATIAHEIRNPLGAIVNSINLLRHPGGAADPRLLSIVGEEADRLDAIIHDFLLFARPPARAPVPTDILDLVETAAMLFRRDAKVAADVTVTVDGPRGLPLVSADPNQLRQVIWNLASNAADVTAPGGHIDIRVELVPASSAIAIHVSDDGPGVPDTELVFEPFFTSKAQGTGLGLAVCARIVRDHGGTIRAENRTPHGAVFTVTLPLPAMHPAGEVA